MLAISVKVSVERDEQNMNPCPTIAVQRQNLHYDRDPELFALCHGNLENYNAETSY